jgi:3-phenylpropionate/trans-cinnamate dioxygenase ferredoxin reductase subunit
VAGTVVVGPDPAGSEVVTRLRAAGAEDVTVLGADGPRVLGVDRVRRRVRLSSGADVAYEHLVLATGAAGPLLPVPGAGLANVLPLRARTEVGALAEEFTFARRVVVVGSGVVALEAAATAKRLGADVTLVDGADQLLPGLLSRTTAGYLAAAHRGRGSRVFLSAAPVQLLGTDRGAVRAVRTADGHLLGADLVLVATGVVPDTALARACGLPADDGVRVDDHQVTADPRVSAVGDCCAVAGPGGGVHRFEPGENLSDQARAVAERLAGGPDPWRVVPSVTSLQCGRELGVVGWGGLADSTRVLGDPAAGAFTVLGFGDGELVAAESVDRPGDQRAVRTLLAAGSRVRADALPAVVDLAALAGAPA